MADLFRWFKVWTTITDDPHFQELSLEQIGRWVLLGAMTASVGKGGSLRVVGEARRLRELLRVDSLRALKGALAGLPNVFLSDSALRWPHGHDKPPVPERGVAFACGSGLPVPLVRGGGSFEEWCARHGDFTATWKNWTKFQRDSTQAARAKASRSKRRGEEIRGEEKVLPHPPPESPSTNGSSLNAEAMAWLEVLNRTAERQFKPVPANLRPILARIHDGYSLTDADAVVSDRVARWAHDPERREYLRPVTVFGTKFDGYLQEARAKASPLTRGAASSSAGGDPAPPRHLLK